MQHQSDGEVILTSRAASKVTSIKGDDTRMEEEDSSIISEEDEMEEAPGMLLDGNKVVALSESKLQNSTSNSVKAPIDPAAFNGISVPCAEKYARTGIAIYVH